MAEPIRWGVLGNATIARKCVLPAIVRSYNGRLHVLGTRRPDKAEKLACRHDIAKVVEGYEAVLKDPDVQAVYIPLPNHLHLPWALKAMEAGKHVLCEKPLACSARQAVEMADAARQSNRVLMEALMYRFHPRSRQIKQMVAGGAIGNPRLVRVSFTFSMDPETLKSGDNIRLKREMGGGALLDVGCYGVSTAAWLLDATPHTVHGMAQWHSTGVDTAFAGTLAFDTGALATIEAGFDCALQQTFSMVGTKGSIELPHNAFIPWEREACYTVRGREDEVGTIHRVAGADEYRLMIEHFGDVVAGISKPEITLVESIENMRVLDALCESARRGQRVTL